MATAANKKTASSKTTATATTGKTAAKKDTLGVKRPARGFAAADTTAAKKPAAKRSAAAKRAEPTGAKKSAAPKLNGDLLAMRTAKNLKQLRVVLDEFPKAVKFSTSTKIADTITLLNVRGKPIAEVTLADKK